MNEFWFCKNCGILKYKPQYRLNSSSHNVNREYYCYNCNSIVHYTRNLTELELTVYKLKTEDFMKISEISRMLNINKDKVSSTFRIAKRIFKIHDRIGYSRKS